MHHQRMLAGLAMAAVAPIVALQVAHGQAPVVAGVPTAAQYAASQEAQAHVARARTIAGADLRAQVDNICAAAGPQRPALEQQMAGQAPAPPTVLAPAKIFDNVYYLGFDTVGAWAITTSDGIILIDTLNTVQEADEIIAAGLRTVGLDPANVKYAVIGHGHFDHFGGAPYFQAKYGTRLAAAAADWDLIERPNPNANPAQRDRPRPTRDIALVDGQQVTLGDTTVTVIATPGHTPGTLGMLFPVKDKGRTLTALMLSGANTTPTLAALEALERALDIAKREKVSVVVSGHPNMLGDELGWMAAIRETPNAPNRFVYGEARFARLADVMVECARARAVAMGEKPGGPASN